VKAVETIDACLERVAEATLGRAERRGHALERGVDTNDADAVVALAEGLAYKHDCFIGVKRNETVELRGDTVVVPEIFGWIDPTQFVVTPALRDAIRAQVALGPTQLRHDGTAFTDAYAFVADRIRTRSNAGIEDDTLEASSPGQSDCLA